MYKKRIFIFLCFIALWGGGALAQQRLLQQAFRFTGISSNEDTNALNTRFSNEGWTFSGSCYGMNNAFLQVGEDDGTLGTVTTPAVPFNGRVQVVVRIYRIQGNSASYSIKTPTNNTITGTVPSENTSYPVTFIVENWTPESKIEISNSGSSYYVTNVDIYDIGNAYYYESFNYMTGKTSDAYTISDNSSDFSTLVYRCDNLGSSFTGNGDGYGLRQSTGAIYFSSNNNKTFVTPVFAAENALLSFKILREENSSPKTFNFTVSGGDGVLLTPLNFTSSTNLSNSCTLNGLSSGLATYRISVGNISGKSLMFTGYHVHLDDIMLLPLSVTTINEGSDNSARIAAYDGMTCDVTLTRTLTKDIWNTMCLPFDVTPSMIGNGAELRTLTSSNEGDFVFNRVEEVEAGTPFLVKVSAEVKNPTFSGVTVENVQPQTVGDKGYKFCGTYSSIDLNTDGTHVFLGIDQAFHTPSAGGNRMNGLRAYFIVPEASKARIAIYDEPSAIHDLSTSAAPKHSGCYDLTGRRHDAKQLSTGLYIRDGRKFYVK